MAHANQSAKKAYEEINSRMHHAMTGDMTGDPDRDFVEGMIPHHLGAIDMARVVIEHGDDAELKKFAGEIIAAQEREMAFLEEWKRRHRA